METRVATARIVADPVLAVIHHIKPNWATALPIQERVCPLQMVKNKGAHFVEFQVIVRFGMVNLPFERLVENAVGELGILLLYYILL
jgi:hypothetical protein